MIPAAAAPSWALVERAKGGDMEAFARLYRRYRKEVMSFALHCLGNRHTAEEITQEVFVRALASLDRVTYQGQDYGAWLHAIARNLVTDHWKCGRIRLQVLYDDIPDDLGSLWPYEPAADVQVIRADTADAVRGALGCLTPEQREVVWWRFFRGLDVRETAAAMGCNEGAVKAAQHRALARIRRQRPDLWHA